MWGLKIMNERSRLKCLSLKQGKLFFRQGLASILMLCKQIQPFSKPACGFKIRLVSPFRGERHSPRMGLGEH